MNNKVLASLASDLDSYYDNLYAYDLINREVAKFGSVDDSPKKIQYAREDVVLELETLVRNIADELLPVLKRWINEHGLRDWKTWWEGEDEYDEAGIYPGAFKNGEEIPKDIGTGWWHINDEDIYRIFDEVMEEHPTDKFYSDEEIVGYYGDFYDFTERYSEIFLNQDFIDWLKISQTELSDVEIVDYKDDESENQIDNISDLADFLMNNNLEEEAVEYLKDNNPELFSYSSEDIRGMGLNNLPDNIVDLLGEKLHEFFIKQLNANGFQCDHILEAYDGLKEASENSDIDKARNWIEIILTIEHNSGGFDFDDVSQDTLNTFRDKDVSHVEQDLRQRMIISCLAKKNQKNIFGQLLVIKNKYFFRTK